MRQIFDVNQVMEDGDYIKVRMRMRDTTDYGVIFFDSGQFYFIQDHLDGCNPSTCSPRDFGYHYSWVSHEVPSRRSVSASVAPNYCPDTRFIITEYLGEDDVWHEVPRPVRETVEFMSKNYEVANIYSGQHGYHSHQGTAMNLPKKQYQFRVGVELEVEFDDEDLLDAFNETKSNWFYQERDGSLDDYGCEIITVPLHPNDAKLVEFWEPLTDYLTGKATSWDNGRCGLHVHVGREALGKSSEEQSETLGKLLYLYHHIVKDTEFNTKVFGRSRSYNEHDGKTEVGNAVGLLGGETLLKNKEICKRVGDAMKYRSSDNRYFDINLQNVNTIEFRKGKGSLKPERIAMIVEYCLILVGFAKRSPWSGISAMRWRDYVREHAKNVLLKEYIATDL